MINEKILQQKYFVGWIIMAVIANINGALREFFIKRYVNELHAHQISTLTLAIFYGIYVWIFLKVIKASSSREAIIIGIIWFGLTLLFEFGFGHFVFGTPWSKLLLDYNIMSGKVWPYFLIWSAVAPCILYNFQKRDL